MSKLEHLIAAHGDVWAALQHSCREMHMTEQAHLSEALRSLKSAIALEHDAHLREIRRLGT